MDGYCAEFDGNVVHLCWIKKKCYDTATYIVSFRTGSVIELATSILREHVKVKKKSAGRYLLRVSLAEKWEALRFQAFQAERANAP